MKKFGWMITNSTQNIGDDFQCIAARQFIGDVPVKSWIDREKMNNYCGEDISIIANGWYMHEPLNWPPSSKIKLLTSIHISNTKQKSGRIPSKYMLSNQSVQYLKQYAPIGGRDTFTVKELKRAGVKAYFSGCLTLTLEKRSENRKSYVCLIDPTKELEKFVRKRTNREVVVVRPEKGDWPENYEERIQKAEELLKIYSEAHLVLTGRLHGALPSLAMGTPVVLLEGKFGDERFEGLKYFVNSCTIKDLYSGKYHRRQVPDGVFQPGKREVNQRAHGVSFPPSVMAKKRSSRLRVCSSSGRLYWVAAKRPFIMMWVTSQ